MKKLLLIFFFGTSPLLLISQTISFDDIKMINSKESFDRFVIENNFESRKSITFGLERDGVKIDVGYGHNLVQGNETIQTLYQDKRKYPEFGGRFEIQFKFMIDNENFSMLSGRNPGEYDATNDYKFILNQVKNQCSFYKIGKVRTTTTYDSSLSEETRETSYSCYTCPSSKYPGKICFVKGEIRINDPYLN